MFDNKINKKVRFSGKMSFVSANPNSNIVVSDSSGESESIDIDKIEKEEEHARYQAAYDDGWQACEKEKSSEISELNEKIVSISKNIPAALNEYLAELETQAKTEIMEMAFSIASIILKEEIAGKEHLKPMLDEALSPVLNLKNIKIHLNPAVAEKIMPGDNNGVPAGSEIISDPKLKEGEALIESSQGIIDATVRGRLETLKENYLKILAEQKDRNA
ncbi:MAG: hypothetical protein A2017_20625 [Lentisphaerae bacterium GWF2_44_16]|nr:MAG: hypothetical protein A2017_20625 [Lentisphaerae bacterium GWF2_44_16]